MTTTTSPIVGLLAQGAPNAAAPITYVLLAVAAAVFGFALFQASRMRREGLRLIDRSIADAESKAKTIELDAERRIAELIIGNLDDDNGDSVHLTLIEGVKGSSPETSSARRKARSLVDYRLPRPATGKHGRAQAGQVFCYEDDSENGIGMVQAPGDTDLELD